MNKLFCYGFTDYLIEISHEYIRKLFMQTPVKLDEHVSSISLGDTVLCNSAQGISEIVKQIKFLEQLHCRIVFFSKNPLHPIIIGYLKNIKDCSILMEFDLKNLYLFKEKYDKHEVFYSKKVEQYSSNNYKDYKRLTPLQLNILVLMFCNYSRKEIAHKLKTTESSVRTRENELRRLFCVETNKELLEVVSLIM